ncbi:MAG: polysaccharide deacetylase family protein [Gammaproteobacteria bacterium]|nr:polysaccharide deacetylase family protein [Gammaproteobacteria bacterium]MYD75435.1 polysaccharide deacetylase family protein [Gammaproteobacteria bacterium]MYJ53103.1 polysaccharide deacetylase family protein [Gammaproteobacteria bacterium]
MATDRQSAIRALSRSCGLVLLYHSISADARLAGKGIHDLSPRMLERHIVDLSPWFRFVSLPEFLARDDPSGLAAVTFDDGYRNVIDNALPVLGQYRIPTSVFLNTVVMEGKLNWRDKVRYLIDRNLVERFLASCELPVAEGRFYRFSKHPGNNSALVDRLLDEFLEGRERDLYTEHPYLGFDDPVLHSRTFDTVLVGNHGARHYVLSSLTDEQQFEEINDPKQLLSSLPVHCLENTFSIPFGASRDINPATLDIARQAGYSNVLMSRQRLHRACRSDRLPRMIERFMPRSKDVIGEILEATGR